MTERNKVFRADMWADLRICRANAAFYFEIENLYPTDLYFLKRYSVLSSKELLREDIVNQRSHFVRIEAYLGIEDIRYLTVVLAIEENEFARGMILERIKELRKEETHDYRERLVAGASK